jgi:hypothetical protein
MNVSISFTIPSADRTEGIDKRVLRRIFGPKMDEMVGWRTLHNKELHDLYASPNLIIIIKSRRIRWVEHVAPVGEKRYAYRIWWESQKERDHWEDLDVGGRIILRWILER